MCFYYNNYFKYGANNFKLNILENNKLINCFYKYLAFTFLENVLFNIYKITNIIQSIGAQTSSTWGAS